jgi:ribonuclease T2
MKTLGALCLSLCLLLLCQPAAQAQQSSRPGEFDYYLFTLSWSPEFCYSHSNSPQCSKHYGFVVHGLWPQFNNGRWPQFCSQAAGPAQPAAMTDLMPDEHLVEHEWQRHGTCSGLSAQQYFRQIRAAFAAVRIPQKLKDPQQQLQFTPAQLKTMFVEVNPAWSTQDVAVSCGHNFLTGISVCLDRSLHPIACKAVRDCRANVVKVPPVR